ncbi:MAG: Crp/Fnr family transcriptional regulator [Pseudomonadota bacterium]
MRDLLGAPSPELRELLPASTYNRILASATYKRYTNGQLIHSRGTQRPGMSVIHCGAVNVGVIGLDGSYLTTSQLPEGQCFGEHTVFAELPRTHDVSAVGQTEIYEISKSVLLRLIDEEPKLARALLTISTARLHGILEFMDDLRRLPLEVRVAKFIFNAVDDSRSISVKQQDLSFTFGVSRVSMGKALKRLERLGLLTLGYGKIDLPDENRLQAWLEGKMLVTPLRANLGN